LRLLMAGHYYEAKFDSDGVTAKEAVLELTAKLTFFVSVALIVTVFAKLVVK
jgi:hypothetical protein